MIEDEEAQSHPSAAIEAPPALPKHDLCAQSLRKRAALTPSKRQFTLHGELFSWRTEQEQYRVLPARRSI
jgi:hypothetical protein